MKSILIVLFFILHTNLAYSSTINGNNLQNEFAALNRDIKHEFLYGDLQSPLVRQDISRKMKKLSSMAVKTHGAKHQRILVIGFKRILTALMKLDATSRLALDMTYVNGLTGREIVIQALDPENNKKIVEIYNQKKANLQNSLTGKELLNQAMDQTLLEVEKDTNFDFLKIQRVENLVTTDHLFSFINEKCIPKYGEEDFHLLIFGFNRCYSPKYKIDRWTVGPGFYNTSSGYSYVTGLKIGKKAFKGIGLRAELAAYYGGGIGVFIGNGLILTLDLERAYGAVAGVSYLNIRLK